MRTDRGEAAIQRRHGFVRLILFVPQRREIAIDGDVFRRQIDGALQFLPGPREIAREFGGKPEQPVVLRIVGRAANNQLECGFGGDVIAAVDFNQAEVDPVEQIVRLELQRGVDMDPRFIRAREISQRLTIEPGEARLSRRLRQASAQDRLRLAEFARLDGLRGLIERGGEIFARRRRRRLARRGGSLGGFRLASRCLGCGRDRRGRSTSR